MEDMQEQSGFLSDEDIAATQKQVITLINKLALQEQARD